MLLCDAVAYLDRVNVSFATPQMSAMINSIGNLAGFVSPYVVGVVSGATHDTRLGMAILAVSMFIGAALTLGVKQKTSAGQHP